MTTETLLAAGPCAVTYHAAVGPGANRTEARIVCLRRGLDCRMQRPERCQRHNRLLAQPEIASGCCWWCRPELEPVGFDYRVGRRGGLRTGVGRSPGLECRVATSPGKAGISRNGPGGARRRARRQPANRTRVLNPTQSRTSEVGGPMSTRAIVVVTAYAAPLCIDVTRTTAGGRSRSWR
jgi:hypothetical protein